MQPIFAVISRGRPDHQPALDWLNREGLPSFLFLHADDPTRHSYEENWNDHVDDIIFHNGKNGPAARNAVFDYFGDGVHVVTIDDDIIGLEKLKKGKLIPFAVGDFAKLVGSAEAHMSINSTRIWGVYPVANAFYMKKEVRFGVYFVSGGVFGVITDRSLRYDEELWFKEDYDLVLRASKRYGGIVRFEGVAMKEAKVSHGGCVEQRDTYEAKNAQAVQTILKRWPKNARRNPRREGEILISKARETRP